MSVDTSTSSAPTNHVPCSFCFPTGPPPSILSKSATKQSPSSKPTPEKKDVTAFVRAAVEKGTGAHLLVQCENLLLSHIQQWHSLHSRSEEALRKLCDKVKAVQHYRVKVIPFVIRLPDERLIASCTVKKGEVVLLLAKDEVYYEKISFIKSGTLVAAYDIGSERSHPSVLSLSYIDVGKISVVMKDQFSCCHKKKSSFITESLSRFYFKVYENTTSEHAAILRTHAETGSLPLSEAILYDNRFELEAEEMICERSPDSDAIRKMVINVFQNFGNEGCPFCD